MGTDFLGSACGRAIRRARRRPSHVAASVAAAREPRKRGVAILLLAILLAACTDLRLSHRNVDPSAALASHAAFRFLRAPLAEEAHASAAARAMDAAVRAAIASALAAKGYREAATDDAAALGVDYTVSDTGGVNAKRLDSPSDYQRSWRTGGPDDGTGSMDHTVADAAFFRELALTVLLFPGAGAPLAWEGTARRSFPGALPQGAGLEAAVGRMIRRLLAPLPAAR